MDILNEVEIIWLLGSIQGSWQKCGVDFDKTFAPVAKMTIVRILLALAASQSWPCFKWTSRMHFYIGIFKNKYTWIFPLVLVLHHWIIYATCIGPFMDWSKLLTFGLKNFNKLYVMQCSSRVNTIHLSLFVVHLMGLPFYWYMLRISLSLGVILMILMIFSTSN